MVTASQAHPAKMAALYMTSSASGFTALLHNYSSEQLEVTWPSLSLPACLVDTSHADTDPERPGDSNYLPGL